MWMKRSTQGRIGLLTLVLALAGCEIGNDATSTTRGAGDSLSTTTTPDTTQPSELGARWTEPPNYRFVVRSSCGEISFIGRYRVTVRDHVAVEAVDLRGGGEKPVDEDFLIFVPTLAGLIEQFETAQADHADVARIERVDGVPALIEIDYESNVIDDEACYEISEFEVLVGEPPADGSDELIAQLFGDAPPDQVVSQERADVIQVWEAADVTVVSDWPGWIQEVEGEVAALGSGELIDLLDGQSLNEDVECPTLMSRLAVVLVLDQCVSGSWSYAEVRSGKPADPPIEYEELLDGEWVWFAERGGTSLHGQGDAEGNLHTIESEAGQDLIAGDYASLPRLSTDGLLVAYVDHDDPAAISHFVSPVVVVRDVATGEELGRWVLDEPVTCLELSAEWLVACLGDPLDYPDGLQNQLAAINLSTGEVTTVTTETRVFLPA